MPRPTVPPRELYQYITEDFEGAWAGVAITLPPGRGNMMFAREAMLLLEWAARYCAGRPVALRRLSAELSKLERRYFTPLPGPCGNNRDFVLPYDPLRGLPQAQLLWGLFDMVRNGAAHQGAQIFVRLPDRRAFGVTISGVEAPLGAPRRHAAHLRYARTHYGDAYLHLCPDTLYLDVRDAIIASGLLTRRRIRFAYVQRPPASHRRTQKMSFYAFRSRALRDALHAGGH